MQAKDTSSALCYIDASHVLSPTGEPAPLDVRTPDNQPIGFLDGVLIDPVERRLRFMVVKLSGSRRYLLPTDCPAQVDTASRSLRIDLSKADLCVCKEFEPSSIRQYSDDDFLGAMFGHRVA